jgi:hypothetical protein
VVVSIWCTTASELLGCSWTLHAYEDGLNTCLKGHMRCLHLDICAEAAVARLHCCQSCCQSSCCCHCKACWIACSCPCLSQLKDHLVHYASHQQGKHHILKCIHPCSWLLVASCRVTCSVSRW